jgi:hypothetical protein
MIRLQVKLRSATGQRPGSQAGYLAPIKFLEHHATLKFEHRATDLCFLEAADF